MNITSDQNDSEDAQKCLKHAIKALVYRKDLSLKINKYYQDKCKKCFGEETLCSICQQDADKEFKTKSEKSISYTDFDGKFNFSQTSYPAGLREIKSLEKINPQSKFRVYQHYNEDFVEIYYTEQTKFHIENPQSTQFIDLVLASGMNYESLETFTHFFPIVNLTTFLKKVYKVTSKLLI